MLDPVFTDKQLLRFTKILMKHKSKDSNRVMGVIPGYGWYFTTEKGLKKIKKLYKRLTRSG